MQAPKVRRQDRAPEKISVDMIPFVRTKLGSEQVKPFTWALFITFGLVLVAVSLMILGVSPLVTYVLLTLSISGLALSINRVSRWRDVPLAVNLNHPFCTDEPMGDSEVMIRTDQGWHRISGHRMKLSRDTLTGDWNLMLDDTDLTMIGTWSKRDETTMRIDLGLVNQALALSDAINDVTDDIEDAREREEQDSGLLEREWIELEEFEIESPLGRMLRGYS